MPTVEQIPTPAEIAEQIHRNLVKTAWANQPWESKDKLLPNGSRRCGGGGHTQRLLHLHRSRRRVE